MSDLTNTFPSVSGGCYFEVLLGSLSTRSNETSLGDGFVILEITFCLQVFLCSLGLEHRFHDWLRELGEAKTSEDARGVAVIAWR